MGDVRAGLQDTSSSPQPAPEQTAPQPTSAGDSALISADLNVGGEGADDCGILGLGQLADVHADVLGAQLASADASALGGLVDASLEVGHVGLNESRASPIWPDSLNMSLASPMSPTSATSSAMSLASLTSSASMMSLAASVAER
jgi:hypothetical protein